MRDAHAEGDSTTVFRYVDWILTVPLMCVEFYLILKAAGATTKHLRDLVVLSTIMLVTGYVGEAGLGNASLWGLFSGLAYFAIVYMIKFGELAKLAASAGGAVQSAHNTLVLFVIIGWAIYPVGYMIGTGDGMWYSFMTGLVAAENMDFIYNVGDSINKIGFGLVVYNLAVSSNRVFFHSNKNRLYGGFFYIFSGTSIPTRFIEFLIIRATINDKLIRKFFISLSLIFKILTD